MGNTKKNWRIVHKYIIKFEVVETCSWYMLCKSSGVHSVSIELENDTDKQINSGPVPHLNIMDYISP